MQGSLTFDSIIECLHGLLDPNLDPNRALDLAFFFTVLDLFDYKFSVDPQTVQSLF